MKTHRTTSSSSTAACECCGKQTTRWVRLLREQDRGTAEALHWAELSVRPMRVPVALAEGHDIPDGYVDETALP